MQAALEVIRSLDNRVPEIGLILGSGLGSLADSLVDAVEFDTSVLPGYPKSTVEGHTGTLIIGTLEGRTVVAIRGRVHCYEGHPVRAVAFPIRLIGALGVTKLIVTNAAGGSNPDFEPGTIMFIQDHINFAFRNPLVGPNTDGGPRFPDMSQPYSLAWLAAAEEVATSKGIVTKRGTYLWTLGPSYETKAEVQAFRRLGADAIGMSTVPEVIQAVYLGMSVLGISTITNRAAGLSDERLSHEDVLQMGMTTSGILTDLVAGIVRAA